MFMFYCFQLSLSLSLSWQSAVQEMCNHSFYSILSLYITPSTYAICTRIAANVVRLRETQHASKQTRSGHLHLKV